MDHVYTFNNEKGDMTKITLPCSIQELSSLPQESKINVTTIFTRTSEEANDQHLDLITNVMKGENIVLSYICDICDKKYKTMNDMNSNQCKHCNKYYDYCKTHETFTTCPFCEHTLN